MLMVEFERFDGSKRSVTFTGTDDEINSTLKGFIGPPITVTKILVLGEK